MQLHPDQRQALESPVTVVKRAEQAAQYPVRIILMHYLVVVKHGDKAYIYANIYKKVPLEAVPYSEEYGEYLGRASEYLKEVITFLFWF